MDELTRDYFLRFIGDVVGLFVRFFVCSLAVATIIKWLIL